MLAKIDAARPCRTSRIGLPVLASSAQMKSAAAANTRVSPPPRQYMTPRFGPLLATPGSNVHRRAPVAAFRRKQLVRRGVAVEHAVDDDRLRLERAGLAGVVRPRRRSSVATLLRLIWVERRVADLTRPAAVAPFGGGRRRRNLRADRPQSSRPRRRMIWQQPAHADSSRATKPVLSLNPRRAAPRERLHLVERRHRRVARKRRDERAVRPAEAHRFLGGPPVSSP